jgi:trigger factor
MKVTVEEISSIKKKLSIAVSQEEYLKELEEAYRKLNQRAVIKGFRKGKVPRPILERQYKESTESDVITHLINESYIWALQDQKIDPVAPPQISDLKKGDSQGFQYVAHVEIRPVLKVSKYKGISLQKPVVEVSDEEVNRELENLRQAQAQMTPVAGESPLQEGQIAIIDFVGRLGDTPFEGGSAKGVSIELGAGRFLKDLEQGILGMKKGDSKTIAVDFPADYPSAELAGKQAQFDVTLNDIKEKILPELNDDFARDLGNFDSLDQIKKNIREHMLKHKEQGARAELQNKVLDHLILEHPFEVPEAMIEQELQAMFENTVRQLQKQRVTPEQAGITPESFRTQNREAAIRRIKGFFLFEAVAQAETIKVAPEELRTRMENIASSLGQKVEVVEQYYREKNMMPMIYGQILEEKVLDFLIAEASVK